MRRNRNSPHRDRVINATMKFIPSTALYFSFLSQTDDSYLWFIRFLWAGMVRRTLISLKLTKKREIVKHTDDTSILQMAMQSLSGANSF